MYVLFILLFVLVGFAGVLMSSFSVCDALILIVFLVFGFREAPSCSGELASVFFRFSVCLSWFLAEL